MAQDDETAPGRKAPPPRPAAAAARTVKQPARPAPIPEEDHGDDRTEPRAPQRPAAPAARPVAPRQQQPQPAARQVPPARAGRPAAPPQPPPRGVAPRLPMDPDRTMGNAQMGGAVAPSAPPSKTSTMAQKLADGVQRSWSMTLGALGGAVFLGIVGMWLVGRGNPVFGVVVMALIIPLTFTALFIRKAPCPSCKQSITVIGIDRCPHCGSYVRLENNQTVLCDEHFIAPLATFETDIPLPIVPRLKWPEEGYCIVCGERAGANDEQLDIQGNLINVPHCGDHQEGVTWSVSITGANVATVKLKFRSWAYWQKFLAANEVHTRQGMWR